LQPLIGNDVVDLAERSGAGKGRDARFITRICAPLEQRALERSQHPDATLWCLWSAKEAAYKIALKRDVDTVFAKQRFLTEGVPTFEDEFGFYEGRVDYEDMSIPVRWTVTGEYVHCVGYWPQGLIAWEDVLQVVAPLNDPTLQGPLSARELPSARSLYSQRARQLAKRLLAQQGFSDVEVVRERAADYWKAPRLWQHGRRLQDSDLSLSHHGRFVAAAVWIGGQGDD